MKWDLMGKVSTWSFQMEMVSKKPEKKKVANMNWTLSKSPNAMSEKEKFR